VYDGNLNSVIGTFVLVHMYIVRMDPQFRAFTNDSAISIALQVRFAYALRYSSCSDAQTEGNVGLFVDQALNLYMFMHIVTSKMSQLVLNTPQAC